MSRWNPKERRTSRRRFNQGKWHQTRKGHWYLFLEGHWRPVFLENGEPLTTETAKKLGK